MFHILLLSSLFIREREQDQDQDQEQVQDQDQGQDKDEDQNPDTDEGWNMYDVVWGMWYVVCEN